MKKFIISIDQGTTSSRAVLFDLKGKPIFISHHSSIVPYHYVFYPNDINFDINFFLW